MSKLFIIHDFSPGCFALFAAFSQHSSILEEAATELAPFNPFPWEIFPTHASLWIPRPENAPLPDSIGAMWAKIAEKLDAGKNILLLTRRPELASHRYFWNHLHERVDLNRHRPEALFIFGRPSLLLEQIFRAWPNAAQQPFTRKYMSWLRDVPDIVPLVRSLSAGAPIETIFNTSESAASTLDPRIFQQALAALGCTAPASLSEDIGHIIYKSLRSRKLMEALEVGHNGWPFLDKQRCRDILLQQEKELPEDWLTPLSMRQEFARAEAPGLSIMEAAHGLAPGTLGAPLAFVTEPELDPASPLSPEQVRPFVAALAPTERQALTARLAQDQPLLNANQQVILAELASQDEISLIGDVTPPVELTVLTMTYNHEKFIGQCMESVLAQKTDFPVRHLVLDHCSTDGTAAIIADYARKYPSIRPVLLSQHAPHENVTGLFLRCRSKYAALCDGDDYFTEPTKLQKQVDMLERRHELALSFHPVAAVFDDGRPPVIFPPLSTLPQRAKNNRDFYLADLMNGNFIQTNSVVYRWRFRDGLPDWFRPDLCPGDYYWHMLHAETGKIGFIPEVMSVYRRHSGALYAQAFVSSKELRRDLGMAELETYSACNEHFHNRYFRSFSRLATGVFADFMQISLAENNDDLLNVAIEKYPEFGKAFLKALKQQNQAT